MTPEPVNYANESMNLKEELQKYFLDSGAQLLMNQLLDSSPECILPHRLLGEDNLSLWELVQVAPMAAIQTFLPFAREKNLKEITTKDVILAFFSRHSQVIWGIIKNKESLSKLLIQPITEKEEILLLFLHSLNLVQVEAFTDRRVSGVVNFDQKKVKLRELFVPPQLVEVIKKGDLIITHCGWVIEKIDEELAKEIRKIQEKIKLDRESLFHLYSRLPSCIDILTVFNGFFSEQHRLYRGQKPE
jgi:hydrogenase maturation factor